MRIHAIHAMGRATAAPVAGGPGAASPPPPGGASAHALLDIRRIAVDDVWERLASQPTGLTAEEADRRLARDGPNALVHVAGPSLLRRLVANLTHVMALLLWIGALVAFIARLPQLGVAIIAVNFVNGVFSFWQEAKAERATEALQRLLPPGARVLRAGQEERVPAEALVVGDVLLIAEGDRISADARLVDAVDLRVDESTLTGESHPVRKSPLEVDIHGAAWTQAPNLVFAGTNVSSGRATAVVHAVGMDTEFGRIASLTQGTVSEDSPLQRELRRLSWTVATMAVGVGALFFGLALALTPMDFGTGFVFTLGMIVAFVPEGLLPTVTLALAMGTQRMAGRNALVKRLSAVETLGSTSVICTDKTGTLTQNEMTARLVWTATAGFDVTGVGYEPAGAVMRGDRVVTVADDPDLAAVLTSAALANNTRLVAEEGSGRWRVLGDPTEAALKVVAVKAGVDPEEAAAKAPRVGELPFDSFRKRMTTIHREGTGLVAHVKGAPRELLERCTRIRVGGRDEPLDATARAAALVANDVASGEAMRVLAVATRRIETPLRLDDADHVERDLTFLGLVAMLDPPHPEVADAIARCRSAGIRILMMTGDYGLTAVSIARRIGLVSGSEARIVNGEELDAMEDTALDAVLADEVVLARATPEHKLRVVAALQRAGEVVAVTGDGVNDAPALKRADIGVAMGRGGTDVAREAADLVLLDDNFTSIVDAVEEGRSVYTNIRKFTGYIFTSNVPEAVPFMVFAFSGGAIPLALGVMHILAIDLGTDLVPALALGSERPEPGLMQRPPRDRNAHLVDASLLRRSYGFLGPLQAAAVMASFFLAYAAAGFGATRLPLPDTGVVYRSATALALSAVVMTQIGNLFAHRTERESLRAVGLTSNRLAFAGIVTELAILAAIVYVPPVQAVVGTAPFPPGQWLVVLAFAPLLLIADELRKAAVRRRARRRADGTSPPGAPRRRTS